jgi:TonB family protein
MTKHQHDIERYLKGELSPAERHALEKNALSDPFLADALEGAEQIDPKDFANDVDRLNKKITEQKEKSFWTWSLRIAASALVLVASTYMIWQAFESQPETKQLALKKDEPAIPQSPTKDSTITSEELSPTTTEQPVAGPSEKDKMVASKATSPTITENKALPSKTDVEQIADVAEETKAEEIKTTEPIAQAKPIEEEIGEAKYKSEEVQQAKKLSLAKEDQRKAAAPSMIESRAAGTASVLPKTIKGKVTSAEDGSGLPGVNVLIKGSTIGTVTDATGNYEIEINNSNPVLVYSFIGLQSKELSAGDRTEMDVALSLDVAQLSEVVVVGYGYDSSTPSTPTVDLAHPTNGYRMFKQYLQQNIRYPEEAKVNKVEGKVTVEFSVETTGALTNFRIIRGIGGGCDEELIRLIREGPVWVPTKKDGAPIQDKAKVRLKFELPK